MRRSRLVRLVRQQGLEREQAQEPQQWLTLQVRRQV